MTRKLNTAILISGLGSNMQALIKAAEAPEYPAKISLVISSNKQAKGLKTAEAMGIPTVSLNHRDYQSRGEFETAMNEALDQYETELICHAGFMRLVTPEFVARWHNKMLNIHPSLLPSFKGLYTHQRVIQAGVKITGCTVHIIRAEMDAGPIIAQSAVIVRENDSAESLSERVKQAEHRLYPQCLALIASGQASIIGDKVVIQPHTHSVAPSIFSCSINLNWVEAEMIDMDQS